MLAAADLAGDDGALFFECRPVVLVGGVRLLERGGDEVAVAVETGELVEHRALEFVAVEPVAVAAFTAELLPAGAGVVVVEAAVAACAHADVGALAAAAADHAGEQEVGTVAAPQRQVVAALPEQRLRCRERVVVDERFVQARVGLAAPVHAAEVRLVFEYPLHNRWLPAARWRQRLLVS
ncbi:MAG TPA: hypothetical protein VFJ93_05350 [Gaiellaceae bacterium]|nr:hypothetical protein [Gaiellaceae bacterium]